MDRPDPAPDSPRPSVRGSGNYDAESVRLASAALHTAIDADWATARALVQQLNDECGGRGILQGIYVWCDTYADYMCDGQGRPLRLAAWRTDTGELANPTDPAAQLPDRVRWATQLVEARCARNFPRFRALIEEIDHDGVFSGDRITAVLECVALTMASLPRGAALLTAQILEDTDG